MDFYSDNDRHAAAWMRELIKAKHLPKGKVDERGIEELQGCDLSRFRRVHLFAGIGGWGYALKLAGWPHSRPVWTGSCPCQPFSAAGKKKGEQDSRHLWPDMFRLIRECRPATVFGEQVSGDDGYRWLAGVFNDLEAEGYACGAADLPACSVGAPHKRHRLFWVANAGCQPARRHAEPRSGAGAIAKKQTVGRRQKDAHDSGRRTASQIPASPDANGRDRSDRSLPRSGQHGQQPQDGGVVQGVEDPAIQSCQRDAGAILGTQTGEHRPDGDQYGDRAERLEHASAISPQVMGHAANSGPQEQWREYRPSGEGSSRLVGLAMQVGVPEWNGRTIAVDCTDGPRRVSAESGAFPLATGLSGRMVRLRGYGNSIVPDVAAAFVRAFLESEITHA